MIILDTNIISEFMTSAPANSVLQWLNVQDSTSLYLTTITIAEICYGLSLLPHGQRRRLLEERFEQFTVSAFESRVLSFDQAAAHLYGVIKGYRKEIGLPLSDLDGQIASIARSKDFAVATQNISDFEHCGIKLINPFNLSS